MENIRKHVDVTLDADKKQTFISWKIFNENLVAEKFDNSDYPEDSLYFDKTKKKK